jgi:hypothetical protein
VIAALVTLHVSWKLLAVGEAVGLLVLLFWLACDQLPDLSAEHRNDYTLGEDVCGWIAVGALSAIIALVAFAVKLLGGWTT